MLIPALVSLGKNIIFINKRRQTNIESGSAVRHIHTHQLSKGRQSAYNQSVSHLPPRTRVFDMWFALIHTHTHSHRSSSGAWMWQAAVTVPRWCRQHVSHTPAWVNTLSRCCYHCFTHSFICPPPPNTHLPPSITDALLSSDCFHCGEMIEEVVIS